MTVDLSLVPISPDDYRALIDHVLALGDKAEADYLELKGTLSFASGSRKEAAFIVARAIIGMANRSPLVAGHHLGGHGVILVGISDGAVTGAEEVDGADLRNAVTSYVGDDGPNWRHVYIDHPDGLVLAIVVHPPKPGDHMHTLRKEFANSREGTPFVRAGDITRPANTADVRSLEARGKGSSGKSAHVVVEYTSTYDYVNPDYVRGWVQRVVDRARDELLFGLERTSSPMTGSREINKILAQTSGVGEPRGEARFRDEVGNWHEEASGLVDSVATEFLRFRLARGQLKVTNLPTTDSYLQGVEVQVDLPADVVVLSDVDRDYFHDYDEGDQFQAFSMLPERPAPWGKGRIYRDIIGSAPIFPIQPAVTVLPDVEVSFAEDGNRYRISWDVGDLRPRASITSDDLFAAYSTIDRSDDLEVHWRVTARGLDHVFEGSLTIARELGGGPELR